MSEFVDYLHEVFQQFGPITARKMFGGHGIYHEGLMFALVTDDTLYLKADETSKQQFIDKGQTPFEYVKSNKTIQISYYSAPEEIYDDPDEAIYWAKLAYQAALNSKSK